MQTDYFAALRRALALALAFASASLAQAQTPLVFEVATIKPANSGIVGMFTFPGGRIEATNFSLRMLLMEAFQLQPFQLSGGPAWMESDLFDVVAKPPADAEAAKLSPSSPKIPLNDQQRLMLQTLLVERFQLKLHHAAKDAPVYLLTRGDKELKLQPPADPTYLPWAGGIDGGGIAWPTGISGKNISMPELAIRLARYMGRRVIDRTGLTGSFDFRYATGIEDVNADVPASIVTSLNALGLKLSASKAPVDAIVVDHAEKPSGN